LQGPIRIIRPSSREREDLLPARLAELARRGVEVRFDDLAPDPDWLYAAAPPATRAAALEAALCEPKTTAVVAARGGYGASDLLPLLDWPRLGRTPPKLVVGFSDISALHAALHARLGWPGLHAPMPATTLWGAGGDERDVVALLHALDSYATTGRCAGAIAVRPVAAAPRPVSGKLTGKLFGGCFSVLTNLIGTPYLPRSFAGTILFLEDTDEHPARLMRYLNQWLQSGLLHGVAALVVGHLRKLGDAIPDCADFVYEEFARRTALPVYRSEAFGHVSPNFPLGIGAAATIDDTTLSWQLSREARTDDCA
jgi:muramoyltetrapeptide carboxypeptidase